MMNHSPVRLQGHVGRRGGGTTSRLLRATLGIAAVMSNIAAASDINVVELTVQDVQTAFASHRCTARQLTEVFLARIATYNPGYNAIITFNPNVLREADEIDRRRAAGEARGPLAGVPVVVKDTMDLAGLPTTAGWPPLSSLTGAQPGQNFPARLD